MNENKASDIQIFDFRSISFFVDYYIVGTISSDAQGSLIIKKISDFSKKHKIKIFASNLEKETGWLILDFGDFMVHLFTEEMRNYYDFAHLWNEAKIEKVMS